MSYFFGMALWLSWELPGTKFSLFVYIYPKNAIFWKFFIDIGEDKKSIWGFKSYNLFSTAFRKVQSKIISPYSLVRLNKNMTNWKAYCTNIKAFNKHMKIIFQNWVRNFERKPNCVKKPFLFFAFVSLYSNITVI